MSKQNMRILKMVLSLLIWPIGIILFFVEKSKKDAQLYLILGIIGLLVFGAWRFL